MDTDAVLKGYFGKDPLAKSYLVSLAENIGRGISVANSELVATKQRPLYCKPANLVLKGDQILDMLTREVEKNPALGTVFPEVAILIMLERTFPC